MTAVVALIAAIRAFLLAAPTSEAIAEDVADILHVTRSPSAPVPRAPAPASRAALAWLPSGDGELGRICALTRDAGELIPWHYSYGAADGLAGRIAFADLVGPQGPCVDTRLRLGLTLVVPHTLYALHAHPARELYCVIAGVARWQAGDVSQYYAPGAFVLHPPGIPHAMETESDALLAVYCWRGDIVTPPFYLSS